MGGVDIGMGDHVATARAQLRIGATGDWSPSVVESCPSWGGRP